MGRIELSMEGLKRKALILSLLDRMKGEDSWCGETHVQKSVYFLQTLLGVPTGYEFIMYKHGPFSFELRDELTAMRAYELVTVAIRPQPYGPSLHPGPLADDLMTRFHRTIEDYRLQVQFIARHLSSKGVAELERLATALYVLHEGTVDIPERLAERVNELKPHISVEEALEAIGAVKQLEMEATQGSLTPAPL